MRHLNLCKAHHACFITHYRLHEKLHIAFQIQEALDEHATEWTNLEPLFAALLYKLKQHAMKECKERAEAYAQCCGSRVFSAVWACRQDLKDLNACLNKQ